MVIAAVSQGGLGLPDRDYYLRDEEKFATTRKQYVEHIAKMFELYTMKWSRVIEKMAGMESIAKTMSEDSTASRTMKSGVAYNKPFCRTKNRSPS